MSISGHRTVSTFLRYDIASDEDKREALRAVQGRAFAVRSNIVSLRHEDPMESARQAERSQSGT
jgi:hypothetical protein